MKDTSHQPGWGHETGSPSGTREAITHAIYAVLPDGCRIGWSEFPLRPVPMKSRLRRLWNVFWGKPTSVLREASFTAEIVILHEMHQKPNRDLVRDAIDQTRPAGVRIDVLYYVQGIGMMKSIT